MRVHFKINFIQRIQIIPIDKEDLSKNLKILGIDKKVAQAILKYKKETEINITLRKNNLKKTSSLDQQKSHCIREEMELKEILEVTRHLARETM